MLYTFAAANEAAPYVAYAGPDEAEALRTCNVLGSDPSYTWVETFAENELVQANLAYFDETIRVAEEEGDSKTVEYFRAIRDRLSLILPF